MRQNYLPGHCYAGGGKSSTEKEQRSPVLSVGCSASKTDGGSWTKHIQLFFSNLTRGQFITYPFLLFLFVLALDILGFTKKPMQKELQGISPDPGDEQLIWAVLCLPSMNPPLQTSANTLLSIFLGPSVLSLNLSPKGSKTNQNSIFIKLTFRLNRTSLLIFREKFKN